MQLKKEVNPMTGGTCCVFKKGENFFYADRSWVSYLACFETMIFPANEDGEVTDWGDLYCDRSGKSLDRCVEEFLAK